MSYAQPVYAQQPAYVQPGVVIQQPQPVIVGGGQSQAPPPSVFGQTDSVTINCPHCKAHAPTRTKCEISGTQWIICIILFIFGCPCPCIPCYIPSCYRVMHSCSSCNTYIGASQ